jgi:hypothetical protein
MMHKLSPELINTICSLGVENRYSAIENYADFLNGAPMNRDSSTTDLGVKATRKCIEEWGGDPSQIGLLVAATNTRDQCCRAGFRSDGPHAWFAAAQPEHGEHAVAGLFSNVEVGRSRAMVPGGEPRQDGYGPDVRSAHAAGRSRSARMSTTAFAKSPGCARATRSTTPAFEQQRNETALLIQMMLFGDGAVRCYSDRMWRASRPSVRSRT